MAQPRRSQQAARTAVHARRLEVARLRLAGVRNQTELAQRLGVSKSTIHTDCLEIDTWWRAEILEDVDAAMREELARLDGLLEVAWPKAAKGNLQAIDRVLAIMDRRMRLLGLEAPKRAVIESTGVVRQYIGLDPANFDFDTLDQGDVSSGDQFDLEALLAQETVPEPSL